MNLKVNVRKSKSKRYDDTMFVTNCVRIMMSLCNVRTGNTQFQTNVSAPGGVL